MQTVNLQYDVPVGYSLDEFVSKVNSYVARLAKKRNTDESVLTKAQKQEAYVSESLTRAFNELKLAKDEGRELQSVDDFLTELDEEN